MRLMNLVTVSLISIASTSVFAAPLFGLPAMNNAPPATSTSSASSQVLSAEQFKSRVQTLDQTMKNNLNNAYKAQLPKSLPTTTTQGVPSQPAMQAPNSVPSRELAAPSQVPTQPMTTPTAPADNYTGFGNYQAPAKPSTNSNPPASSGGWNVSY